MVYFLATIAAWFTTLVQTETSQRLLDGWPWHFLQTFMVPWLLSSSNNKSKSSLSSEISQQLYELAQFLAEPQRASPTNSKVCHWVSEWVMKLHDWSAWVLSLAVPLSKWIGRNVSYVTYHYEYRRSPLKLPLVAHYGWIVPIQGGLPGGEGAVYPSVAAIPCGVLMRLTGNADERLKVMLRRVQRAGGLYQKFP